MNKEEDLLKIKEFDENQLSKLISDLRDINSYTSFKNGSFIYNLGKYQGNLLINYIEQLQNNWNELKNWLEEDLKEVYRDAGYRHNIVREILDKMEELENK